MSQYDARFVQGDTQYFDVSVVDGDDESVDLTDASIEYQLTNDDITITKTVGDGITVTDAVAGECEIVLAPSDTSTLSRLCSHSIEITDSNGDVSTVLDGTVYVELDPN